VELAPKPVTAPARVTRPAEPADLLGEANALRAQRRFSEALDRYVEIVRRHPGTPQAAAARLAAATLRLEHTKDPRGALELLEDATPTQQDIPEAAFLLAESHRATGDRLRERQSLEKFLSQNPDHPLAAQATRRLQALDREDASETDAP
jgi:tetratricopeptide (TPR) repeat protein